MTCTATCYVIKEVIMTSVGTFLEAYTTSYCPLSCQCAHDIIDDVLWTSYGNIWNIPQYSLPTDQVILLMTSYGEFQSFLISVIW